MLLKILYTSWIMTVVFHYCIKNFGERDLFGYPEVGIGSRLLAVGWICSAITAIVTSIVCIWK